MDVSNSTPDSADYRVTSKPGGMKTVPPQPRTGLLKPDDYAVEDLPNAESWIVEFMRDGKVIARTEVVSRKASIELIRSGEGYEVKSSVARIDAFITYSAGEKDWAKRLEADLRENSVSTWLDAASQRRGSQWQEELRRAAFEAKNIVVVIGPTTRVSEKQRQEWGIALEAIWRDSNKRLIPLLLQGVEVPGFFRSAASPDRPVTAIRIENPARDWDRTVADLVKVLKSEADPREKGEIVGTTEEDRRHQREWFAYLRDVAEGFRSARKSA